MTDLAQAITKALADRYAIRRELGRGGMASVFLAEDLKHHRDVAIKVVTPEIASVLGAERFLREIEIAARLTHPHILPLHDSGQAGGFLYYVMPYVEGETLRARLTREKQLPLDDATRIAREVADALHYAHNHGVIHRDIKPENILLEAGHAVVADFGIARAAGQAGADRLTATGMSLGTPAYMSPEQAAGSEDVDARADVYALACMLHEMLAGQPPYIGATPQSVVQQHMTAPVPNVVQFRSSVPAATASAIQRALAKLPADRFGDAAQFASAIVPPPVPVAAAPSPATTPRPPVARARRTSRALVVSLTVVVLILLSGAFARTARVLWARTRAIPALQELVASGDWEAAQRLAARVDGVIPNDSSVAALRGVFADTVRIVGEPAGARIYRRAYTSRDGGWELIGTAPIEHAIVPRRPVVSQFRIEADGYATAYDIAAASAQAGAGRPLLRYRLVPEAEASRGMVRVVGGTIATGIAKLDPGDVADVADFLLDRLEVTNREFQEFVDSGGYQRRELWEHDFRDGNRGIAWQEAMSRFVDQTGRPGPSTWEAGRHPAARADHPVSGVSWYEAAAYAKYRGKRLPNVFEWARAAEFYAAGAIVGASNIQNVRDGTAAVGAFRGMSGSGAFDMAGNVREWVINEARTRNGRYILGGAWNDQAYKFFESEIQSPFERSPANGIRLARSIDGVSRDASGDRPIEPLFRDYAVERPVSDDVFAFYRRQFAYDRLPLNARVESRDSTDRWIVEKVSYDAAYGGERIAAHLYLPRRGTPPWQTTVYFPGSTSLTLRTSSAVPGGYFDFLIEDGRAVIFPIYKGTYERDDGTRHSDPDASNSYREHVVMWQRDVSRTLDYLATRSDVDTATFAYLGVSWGGRFGGVVLSTEPRFKAAVLTIAGLNFRPSQPEADDLNYVPRVRTPVLMINGRHDSTFPLETSAEPMYRLLGTPAEHKKHVVVDGVHYVPRNVMIRETLAWFDRYLGPAR